MTERADQLHHDNALAFCAVLVQVYLAKHHITQFCSGSLHPRFGSLRFLAFPKGKIAVEREEVFEGDCRTVHKFNKRRLTTD